MPATRPFRALAALVVAGALAFGSAQAQEVVQLRFVSLAWQEQAIAAVRSIVDAWNAQNPNVQVQYEQVDWGSIHD